MSDHLLPYLADCSLLFTEELRRPPAAPAAGCSAEFRDNVDVVAGIGERLGMRGCNAPYGTGSMAWPRRPGTSWPRRRSGWRRRPRPVSAARC